MSNTEIRFVASAPRVLGLMPRIRNARGSRENSPLKRRRKSQEQIDTHKARPYHRIRNAAKRISDRSEAGRASLSHRLDVPHFSGVLRADGQSRRAVADFERSGHAGGFHLHEHAAQALV